MRFTIVGCLLAVFLANAIAGPIKKISDKKFLIENTKVEKEELKIDEIGADKDRSKKSTTTFCVEIRPGSNEPVQCSCKDKETHEKHLAVQQVPQPVPYAAPQPPAPIQPASQPHSVNIIHAPALPPQTLNIIQPAPTLHAVQFLQPQSPQGPSSIQTLNFLQPSNYKNEPYHQTFNFTVPSEEPKKQSEEPKKPSEPVQYERIIVIPTTPSPPAETIKEIIVPEPAPEVIIIPQPAPSTTPEPIPEPTTPQPEHTDSAHKSEIHVSVVTEDKKDQEEQKPQPSILIEPVQTPVEPAHVLPYSPEPQSYEKEVVVVPNPILVEHQENCPAALIQIPSIRYQPSESIIQFPGSSYQQGGQFQTECSCKQTRPVNSNLHLVNPTSSLRHHHHDRTQIVPMVIYPPSSPTVGMPSLAGYQSHSPHRDMFSISGQPSTPPMVISMQSIRNKEGMQEEMSGMTDMNGMSGMNGMNGMTGRNNEQTSNTSNNMMSELPPLMSFMPDKNTKKSDETVETKKINEKTS